MKEFEKYKAVFLAAYHNNLFDVWVHKTGMCKRKEPKFISKQHIVDFFHEAPYVLTRVGEYIHFYEIEFHKEKGVRKTCFRIKETSIGGELEVETTAWGALYEYRNDYSKEYREIVTAILVILTQMDLYLK